MRKHVTTILSLAVLTAVAFPGPIAAQEDAGWARSLAEGQRLARAQNRPLMIVFRCER